jgi:P-type Ca2+ transporter type 2C
MTVAIPRVEPVSPPPCLSPLAGQGRGLAKPESAPPEGGPKTADADKTGIRLSIVPVHTTVAGRVRLHVAGLRGAPELAKLIERGLTGFGGVREVSANALTGNVLVFHAAAAALDQIVLRIAALLRGDIVPASDETESSLKHWHAANETDIAAGLGTDMSRGLSSEEAGRRLTRGGANVMPSPRQRSELSILLGQFRGLPVALLAGAAVVSVAVGSLVEAGAIMAVVALNGAIGFATERRAERTIRSLEGIGAQTARVLRDGSEREIPGEALVPGDVMILQRGMVAPVAGSSALARLPSAKRH